MNPDPKPQHKSRFRRILAYSVLGLVLLLVLLPLALYIPVVQDWACSAVVSYLNATDSDLEYSIGKVRIDFPLRLRVNDVDIYHRDTHQRMLHLGRVATGLDDIPINQPFFVLGRVEAEDIEVGMDPLTESFGVSGALQRLIANRVELDLSNTQVRLEDLLLDRPDLHLYLSPSEPDSIDEPSTWSVSLRKVLVREGQLTYDHGDSTLVDAHTPTSSSYYFDYNHLSFSDLSLEAEHLQYQPDLIRCDVNDLKGHELNSGLDLQHFAVKFRMEDDLLSANSLDLHLSDDNRLSGEFALDLRLLSLLPSSQDSPVPSSQPMADSPDSLTVPPVPSSQPMAESPSSPFAFTSLLLSLDSLHLFKIAGPYLPRLRPTWQAPKLKAELQTQITPQSLDLPRLSLHLPGYAKLVAEGACEQYLDDEHRTAAFTLKGDLPQADFILSSFLGSPDERAYRLPPMLQLDMEAAQQQKRLSARIDMQQADCDILRADATYDVEFEAYHLNARTQGLNVSDFMPSLVADRMTAQVQADGRHFRLPSPRTRLQAEARIDTLYFTDPSGLSSLYTGISANGALLAGNYTVDLHSDYRDLRIDSHLEGCYLKDTLRAKGHLDVPQVNLANLPMGYGLADGGKVGVKSQIDLSYDLQDIAHINVRLDSLTLTDAQGIQHFDTISFQLESRPGLLDSYLSGGDAMLNLSADMGIRELPTMLDTLTTELNRQLETCTFNFDALQSRLPHLSLDFDMAQQNPFYQLISNKTGYAFRRANLSAFRRQRLNVGATIYDLSDAQGSLSFDTIDVHLWPQEDQRTNYLYSFHALHVNPRPNRSYNVRAGGQLMPDSITMGFSYINGNYLTLYDVAASLALAPDSVTLHLEKDPTLYEQPFSVNRDNYVSLMNFMNIKEHKVNTKARVLMQGPRDLSFNLYTRALPNSEVGNQMLCQVRNLDLGYATDVMQWQGDAGGRFNMTAQVSLLPDSLHARIRSGVKDFHLGDYRVDTLSFDGLAQFAPSRRDVSGLLTVDSIVKLDLKADLSDTVNVEGKINELPLPLLNTFLPTNMQLSGQATGALTLRGHDMEHARVNAHMVMQKAGLNYNDLDAQLQFCEDTIRVRNNRLLLRDYELRAANANPVKVRGLVDFSKDVSDPRISLTISGENVRLINNNRLRLPNQYVSGRLPISPDIKVSGTLSKMSVTGRLNLLQGTRLDYFMSDDPLESSSKVEQLVDFVNFFQLDHTLNASGQKRDPIMRQVEDESLYIDLGIEIDPSTSLTAHLAGTDNNRVDIVGGGSLRLGTDRKGDLIMSGLFNVNGGKVDYKLPILPVVKTFDINNSSTVAWNGNDPTSPDINIQASEEIRTTVNDNMGQRLVRFLVDINISGTLEKLNMTFDCSAPEDGTCSNELSNLTAEERSKTALLLLVTQTYVSPSNTTSMGLGAANAALNSMLNRQVESMLGDHKGTNIDLGIDTYSTETGGTRTNYSFKVSQNLFNDRFRATLGGEINSGEDLAQAEGIQLGDMSLEWLIKRDGSHYLKIFRRNNFQSILVGHVIETGISYVQERSAYRYRQLFIPTSRKRQQQLEQMVKQLREQEENEARSRRTRAIRQQADSLKASLTPQSSPVPPNNP